jgi:DNA-binding SARP family transcriptional activator
MTRRQEFILQLLGGVYLRGPGGPLAGAAVQRRRLALLVLLGGARSQVWSRDKLVGYLWPDCDERHARHLLSNSLYSLRQALGAEAVVSAEGSLRINETVVHSDIAEFEGAIERDSLEEAASVYAGPFADGFYVSGTRELDGWLDSQRQHFEGVYTGCLEALATEAESVQDYPRACHWWQQLAAHNPYNSRVVLRLVESLTAAGDPADAVQSAREHAVLLAEELGMNCPPDLAEFARGLKRS